MCKSCSAREHTCSFVVHAGRAPGRTRARVGNVEVIVGISEVLMKGWLFVGLVLMLGAESRAAPWQIGAQGTLYTADGRPAQGIWVVTFRVFEDADATVPAWEEDVPLGLEEGRFATALPVDEEDMSLVTILHASAGAELSIVLDDGYEVERTPLTGAPYAIVAERVRHVAASQVTYEPGGGGAPGDVQAALAALTARVTALEGQGGGGGALPSGAILMFSGACPGGWSEVSGLAGRVPLGVGPGLTIGSSGGAATHGHVVTVASGGAHQHDASGVTITVEKLSGGMPDLSAWMPTIACATSSTTAGGNCGAGFAASAIYHNHPASASGQVASGGAHVHTAEATDASSLPPYQVVRFCAKP